MGRKKLTNERFQVRCHPKVIKDVREIARNKSAEFLKQELSKSKRNEST